MKTMLGVCSKEAIRRGYGSAMYWAHPIGQIVEVTYVADNTDSLRKYMSTFPDATSYVIVTKYIREGVQEDPVEESASERVEKRIQESMCKRKTFFQKFVRRAGEG